MSNESESCMIKPESNNPSQTTMIAWPGFPRFCMKIIGTRDFHPVLRFSQESEGMEGIRGNGPGNGFGKSSKSHGKIFRNHRKSLKRRG